MVWTKDKPKLNHEWYWFRPAGSSNEYAQPVFVRFDSTDFQMTNGEWSHTPIPLPEERVV